MDIRPKLDKKINIEDFRDFYWLKEELINFCRKEGLNKQGGKIELTARIEKYIITGRKETSANIKKQKPLFSADKRR